MIKQGAAQRVSRGIPAAVQRRGFIRDLARVIQEPSLPFRTAWRRLPFGSFDLRCDLDLFPRPYYAYGIQQAALLARDLGLESVTAIEFGVAGGRGLLELERMAILATEAVGVRVEVYGFDRAVGLPVARGYKDLPYIWREGFFEMDVDTLRARLTRAELVLGELSETVPSFISRRRAAPVGFVSIDLDYYSSTVDALKIFDSDPALLLPRIFCYFDDIIGDDICLPNEYVGELAAIREFNDAHADRKLCPIQGLVHKRIIKRAPWCDQMYALHCFDHEHYCAYVGIPVAEQLRGLPL